MRIIYEKLIIFYANSNGIIKTIIREKERKFCVQNTLGENLENNRIGEAKVAEGSPKPLSSGSVTYHRCHRSITQLVECTSDTRDGEGSSPSASTMPK